MGQRSGELTVDEIESEHGSVRDSPVVDWFTLPYDRIPQSYEIPNGRARPEVLQVWSGGSILTIRDEVFELLFDHSTCRVQFVEVSFVELSGDRFVDVGDRGVIPESGIFLCGIETVDLSGTEDNMRSVNRTEARRRGLLTMCTLPREGPRRSRRRNPGSVDQIPEEVLTGLGFLSLRAHL